MEKNLPANVGQGTALSVFSFEGFDHAQRIAKALSASKLVPEIYRGPEGIANCLIALELSYRMGASPMLVMQNLDIIHGRPSWRSQFKIAQVNASGRFSALQYDFEDKPGGKFKFFVWVDDGFYQNGKPKRKKVEKEHTLKVNKACRAWAKDRDGNRLDGPWISLELALKEGWYFRDGSKWETMPEKMLMYRAGSWFVDVYDPGATMGIKTVEELIDADFEVVESSPNSPRPTTVDDLNNDGGVYDPDNDGEGYSDPDNDGDGDPDDPMV